ncbi:hypothetical protein GS416_09220, partial [Rhodococcus hoagii]|nr:hypothetical protein [Prescottella equi]
MPGAVVFDLPVGDWRIPAHGRIRLPGRGPRGHDRHDRLRRRGYGARAGVLKGGVGHRQRCHRGRPGRRHSRVGAAGRESGGSVWDPRDGTAVGTFLADAERRGMRLPSPEELSAANALAAKGTVLNTTIGVSPPTRSCRRRRAAGSPVAGHDGMARAIRPA